jgi:L-ribulokinase
MPQSGAKQTCTGSANVEAGATGAALGGYDSIYDAAQKMAQLKEEVFLPIPEHVAVYEKLYAEYLKLHDYFGRGGNDVMKTLKGIKAEARK